MTRAEAIKLVTPEEYLRQEESALDRHEYHAGEVLAMSGGTYVHGRISTNLIIELGLRLKGASCFALDSNTRVRLAASNRYVYPDATVVCGQPVFDPLDKKFTTIINPTVIVEVLSESTEAYDRGAKFSAYRDLASFREYVLVSQSRPMVETYYRREDGSWLIATFEGLEATAKLQSLNVDIRLSDIYAGLTFTSPAASASDQQ